MHVIHAFAFVALSSATVFAGTAMAGEPLHLTPPLYREQARTIQQMRPVSDLATTPQPVVASKPVEGRHAIEVVAEATQVAAR